MDELRALCQRRGISELAVFGSALREDFRPESDVDVLVTFEPGVQHRLTDVVALEEELERLFGRKVDIVTRSSVERSRNYIFRRHVLSTVQPLYVA